MSEGIASGPRRPLTAALIAAVVVVVGAVLARSAATAPATQELVAAPFAQASLPKTPEARAAKGVAVVGMEQDAVGFNTALACCAAVWPIVVGTVPTLRGAFTLTNRLEYVPDLVTKVVATKRTLTYRIRADAYWYWGGRKLPVTYRDFVYTWRQLVDPENDVVLRDGYDQITGATHVGEKTVVFRWKKPYANYRALFGWVYPAAALQGTTFNEIWTNCICGNDGKPISDGPFYLAAYTRGQGLTLKANPYWYGRKPGLSEIVFRIIADTNAEIQAMRGGEVDAIQPSVQSALTTLQHRKDIAYGSVPGLSQEHIEIQFGSKGYPLLRAPWFRQAIMLGIDRRALVRAFFADVAPGLQPLDSLLYFPPDARNYRRDFARWDYDPAKAIALLRRHGCTGGPSRPTDGNASTFTCAGYPAKISLTTTAGNRRRETGLEILKAELGAIGIQLTGNLLPANVLFSPAVFGAGNYDLLEYALVTTPDPGLFVPVWSCGGPANTLGYCNRRVTNLLQASDAELDPERRAQDFREADALLAQDVPAIPLYAPPTILVHKASLAGMKSNPVAFTWNIEDWHWK